MSCADDCAASSCGELDFEPEEYNEKCGVFGAYVRSQAILVTVP